MAAPLPPLAEPRTPAAGRGPALGVLRHRNYRLFFAGQVVATTGGWVQATALSWTALRMTHSALWVSVVVAAQIVPSLLSPTAGGVAAERRSRHRLLMATQGAHVLVALSLALAVAGGRPAYPVLVLLALVCGAVNLFDVPARQGFVIEMVGRPEVVGAIALSSSVLNAAAVAGPAIAGLTLLYLGAGTCFLMNALAGGLALASLATIRRLPRLMPRRDLTPAGRRLIEGLHEVGARRELLLSLVASAALAAFAMNRMTLLPVYTASVLDHGPLVFGLLMASVGAGSFAAALTLGMISASGAALRMLPLGVIWAGSAVLFGALSRTPVAGAVVMALSGFCQILYAAGAEARIQQMTRGRATGRVMTVQAETLAAAGVGGNVLAGAIATAAGAPAALIAGGAAAAVIVAGTWLAGRWGVRS